MVFNNIELSPDQVKVKFVVQKVGYKLEKPFKRMLKNLKNERSNFEKILLMY